MVLGEIEGKKIFWVSASFERVFLEKLKIQVFKEKSLKKAQNPNIFFYLQFHPKPSTFTIKYHIFTEKQSLGTMFIFFAEPGLEYQSGPL